MNEKPVTTPIAYVEHIRYPGKNMRLWERFEPCKDGEKCDAMFGTWPDFTKMKLIDSKLEEMKDVTTI